MPRGMRNITLIDIFSYTTNMPLGKNVGENIKELLKDNKKKGKARGANGKLRSLDQIKAIAISAAKRS